MYTAESVVVWSYILRFWYWGGVYRPLFLQFREYKQTSDVLGSSVDDICLDHFGKCFIYSIWKYSVVVNLVMVHRLWKMTRENWFMHELSFHKFRERTNIDLDLWPSDPWTTGFPLQPNMGVWTTFEEGRARRSGVIDRKWKGNRRTDRYVQNNMLSYLKGAL